MEQKAARLEPASVARWALAVTLVAAAYFAAGKLGLRLAFVHASATAVWPPTGIALAAILLLGFRVWPGIFLGAFLVNITTAGSLAACLGIATGNTLEGVVGAYLLHRCADGVRAFETPAGVVRFAFFAAVVSTAVSATFGVTSLCLDGAAAWANYGGIWLTWWLGDAGGALVVAPLLVLWAAGPRPRVSLGQAIEAAALFGAVAGVGRAVFGPALPAVAALSFLCAPLVGWAALRFGRAGERPSSRVGIAAGAAGASRAHAVGELPVVDRRPSTVPRAASARETWRRQTTENGRRREA